MSTSLKEVINVVIKNAISDDLQNRYSNTYNWDCTWEYDRIPTNTGMYNINIKWTQCVDKIIRHGFLVRAVTDEYSRTNFNTNGSYFFIIEIKDNDWELMSTKDAFDQHHVNYGEKCGRMYGNSEDDNILLPKNKKNLCSVLTKCLNYLYWREYLKSEQEATIDKLKWKKDIKRHSELQLNTLTELKFIELVESQQITRVTSTRIYDKLLDYNGSASKIEWGGGSFLINGNDKHHWNKLNKLLDKSGLKYQPHLDTDFMKVFFKSKESIWEIDPERYKKVQINALTELKFTELVESNKINRVTIINIRDNTLNCEGVATKVEWGNGSFLIDMTNTKRQEKLITLLTKNGLENQTEVATPNMRVFCMSKKFEWKIDPKRHEKIQTNFFMERKFSEGIKSGKIKNVTAKNISNDTLNYEGSAIKIEWSDGSFLIDSTDMERRQKLTIFLNKHGLYLQPELNTPDMRVFSMSEKSEWDINPERHKRIQLNSLIELKFVEKVKSQQIKRVIATNVLNDMLNFEGTAIKVEWNDGSFLLDNTDIERRQRLVAFLSKHGLDIQPQLNTANIRVFSVNKMAEWERDTERHNAIQENLLMELKFVNLVESQQIKRVIATNVLNDMLNIEGKAIKIEWGSGFFLIDGTNIERRQKLIEWLNKNDLTIQHQLSTPNMRVFSRITIPF